MADLASSLRSSAPSLDELSAAGGMTDVNGDTTYQYKDASGGTVTVDSTGKSVGYTPTQSWYQQQYAAHPDAIRSGMNNEQYLALGPLDQTYNLNGQNVPITGAYEYQIDPKTGALSNTPVDRKQSSNFTDWATTPAGALTLAGTVLGGAYGASALAGEGAAGGASSGFGINPAASTGTFGSLTYPAAGSTFGALGGAASPAGIAATEAAAGLGLGSGTTAGLSALQKAQLLRMGVNSLGKMTGGTGGGGYSTMAGGTGGMTAYQRQNPYLSTSQQNTVPDTTTASLINLLRGQNG